jgi:hypothetical protein
LLVAHCPLQRSGIKRTTDRSSVHLTFHCPACEQQQITGELSGAGRLECSACAWSRALPDGEEPLTRCLVCGNTDLWKQKNFPQPLGLAMVAAGALLSSVAWYFHRPLTALGLLMAFALLDMLVFLVLPDVLVCYRCRARHHALQTATSEHSTFNHQTAERYRQQQIRERDAQRIRRA